MVKAVCKTYMRMQSCSHISWYGLVNQFWGRKPWEFQRQVHCPFFWPLNRLKYACSPTKLPSSTPFKHRSLVASPNLASCTESTPGSQERKGSLWPENIPILSVQTKNIACDLSAFSTTWAIRESRSSNFAFGTSQVFPQGQCLQRLWRYCKINPTTMFDQGSDKFCCFWAKYMHKQNLCTKIWEESSWTKRCVYFWDHDRP